MNVTLGILAQVDGGKTTLSEQLLYRGGALRSVGRVDDGGACMDFTAVERARGITVFSAQAVFSHGDNRYFLLDTPGHGDFSPEMERCLAALDAAILVIGASLPIPARTERLWQLLERRGIPVLCFLNKTDLAGADPDGVLEQLHRWGDGFCEFWDGLTDAVREQVAMTDDALLESYLEGTLDDGACWEGAGRAFRERLLFPVYRGSALKGEGIDELLDGLDRLCRTDYDPNGPLNLLAYQIRRDKQERVCCCKVLSGTLRPRQTVNGEKVHQLRRQMGGKWEQIAEAQAGELVSVTGLSDLRAGDQAGETLLHREPSAPPPLLVEVRADAAPTRLLEIFRQLEDEEPTLAVRWNEGLHQLHVAVAGEMQLDVLTQTVKERYDLDVTFGEPAVAYRETIAKPVRGCGHFEPLRHYAEVQLLLEPNPRGAGVTFESRCSTDDLALNWQRLIETHVLEKAHVGAMLGASLTDVHVVLLGGRAHDKHTEGGDFRQAVYRAIRHGLFHAENRVLEPWYRFTIQADPSTAAKLQTEISRMGGVCDLPETVGAWTRLTGRCPVAPMLPFSREFATKTRGGGSLQLEPDGYAVCPDGAAVAAASGYDRERDTENPADSIFCSHGAGHSVSWREAADHMHVTVSIRE